MPAGLVANCVGSEVDLTFQFGGMPVDTALGATGKADGTDSSFRLAHYAPTYWNSGKFVGSKRIAAATTSLRLSGGIGLVKKSSNPASMQRRRSSG